MNKYSNCQLLIQLLLMLDRNVIAFISFITHHKVNIVDTDVWMVFLGGACTHTLTDQ